MPFVPNNIVREKIELNSRPTNIKWGTTALKLSFDRMGGYYESSSGLKVEAFKGLQETLKIQLHSVPGNEIIKKEADFFEQFSYEISYNCFGHCFADSQCIIYNPMEIVEAEYDKVSKDEAEVILFMIYQGRDDNGELIHTIYHAIKVLPNGNVSFKEGMLRLIEDVPMEQAFGKYNYSHLIYLRRKL